MVIKFLNGEHKEFGTLRGADLLEADLRGADISDVIYNYSTVGIQNCPDGDIIAWKKVNGEMIKMLVPANAKRSCSTTRKCRFQFVKVLSITGGIDIIINRSYVETVYKVGEFVYPDEWDDNRWNECSNGIHGFLDRNEAEQY